MSPRATGSSGATGSSDSSSSSGAVPVCTLVGAGGLGGPLAYALARAGIALEIYDPDTVELSNLQRQIQFVTADIGQRKVDALAAELSRRGHPRQQIRVHARRWIGDAASPHAARAAKDMVREAPREVLPELLREVLPDVLVDGSDDFATKFAVNDYALRHGVAVVIASVMRWTGQIFVRMPGAAHGCYRCLFEEPPGPEDDADAKSCQGAGVMGAAVAVVAGLAARAALALARGQAPLGSPRGGLFVLDDVRAGGRLRSVHYAPRPGCSACRTEGKLSLRPPLP